jgi:hypothetical protein
MTTIAADHPMPPAFRFKQSLAHNPTMLGPRFANITPILRAPVFLLETGVRPCNADLISPATIKTPYPSIVLQMSPFDAENGEVYVFTILDSRTAKIPGLVPENILSVLACSFQANGRPQVLDAADAAPAPGLGGSHASPRWHERRGHWRHLKDGKEVWVRHCEVGLPGRGGALHDYLVAGPG